MRISQRAKPACGVFDLQQPQDHIDQYDNGEAQGAVQAGRDLLKHAKKPTHVEMFCPHPGQNYAVAFQPIGELRVMGLKARRVTNDVPADPSETPCDHRPECSEDQDRHQNAHRKRHELRHPGLKAALDRPYQCNDEDRER